MSGAVRVASVAGKTGAVTLVTTDVTGLEPRLATVEMSNLAQDEAIAALGGGNGAVPVFIQDTEPDFDGAALWIQPGGGFAIQEAA